MTSRHSSLSDIKNSITAKEYLEYTVMLFEQDSFFPVVFAHDDFWFSYNRYAQVIIGFTNLLFFLDSCGITVETEIMEPSELQVEIYANVMKDVDHSQIVKSYELRDVDCSALDFENIKIPENCQAEDFSLVKVYLILRTGAALNKAAFERIMNKKLTDSSMLTIRRTITNITGKELVKRKDNSYELR